MRTSSALTETPEDPTSYSLNPLRGLDRGVLQG